MLFVVPAYAVLLVKGRYATIDGKSDAFRALDLPLASQKPRLRRPLVWNARVPRSKDGNFYSFELLRGYEPLAGI